MKETIEKINFKILYLQNMIIIDIFIFLGTLVLSLFIQESYHQYLHWLCVLEIVIVFFLVALIWWHNSKKLKIGNQDLISKGFDHIAGNRFYCIGDNIMYVVDLIVKNNKVFYVLDKRSLEIDSERLSSINWFAND